MGRYQDRRRPGRIRQDRSAAENAPRAGKLLPRGMSRRLRGIFWSGAHCCPGEEHSAPTRRSIAPLIQTGSDRTRGTFALSDVTYGAGAHPSSISRPCAFMASSNDRRSASLPNARRSSLKSPLAGTRSPQSIPSNSIWLRNLIDALRPASSLSRAIQMRLILGVGTKRPRWLAVRQEARSNSGRAVPTERVFSSSSPTMRSERPVSDQKRAA